MRSRSTCDMRAKRWKSNAHCWFQSQMRGTQTEAHIDVTVPVLYKLTAPSTSHRVIEQIERGQVAANVSIIRQESVLGTCRRSRSSLLDHAHRTGDCHRGHRGAA